MRQEPQLRLIVLAGLVLLLVGLITLVTAKAVKVNICHIPPDDPANFHTIIVSENAIAAHEDHGDKVTGACDLFEEALLWCCVKRR